MSTSVASTPAQGLQRWMILASGVGGSLIIVMGLSGAGIALPHMQGAFSAAPDQIAWVLTSFIVSSTLTMACSGWLSDRFGRRRIYLLSIAGFTIASALCGIADTLAEEVLYRTLQGAFGGPLLPLGQVIAVDPFPREKQGFATSMWGMGAMWGTVFGSLSGGYLVDHLSWSWVFFINVPLGAVAFLCAWAYVPETVQSRGRPLDWMGFVALCLAVCAFQLMLNRGERLAWFESPEIILETVIAACVFYIFVAHSFTARQPFFEPRLFADRNFAIGQLLILVYGGIAFLPLFMLPLILQGVAGYPPTTIGLLLGTRGLGVLFGLIVIVRLTDRVDPRLIIAAGLGCFVVAGLAMSEWGPDIPVWSVIWAIFFQGIGSSVAYIPISIMTFSTLSVRLRTEGMAIFHLLANLGTATGTAIVFNLLSRDARVNREVLSAHVTQYNEAFQLPGARELWTLTERSGLAAIEAEIGRQATMIAFNNTLYLTAVIGLAILPLILLLRRSRCGTSTDDEG